MNEDPWFNVARTKIQADLAEENVHHAEEILMRAINKLAIFEAKLAELTLVALAADAAKEKED
jgi:hypothetical protein